MLAVSLSSVKAGDVYVKVTSPEQLVTGAKYIIAAQTGSGDTYVATSYDDGSSKKCLTTTNKGFTSDSDGAVIAIDTADPLVFELGGDADGYTLKFESSYYLRYSSGTDLSQSKTISNSEKWIYSYDETYSYLLKNVSSTNRMLQFQTIDKVFKPIK